MAPVGDGRVMVLHAVNQLRWVVDSDLAQLIDIFHAPQPLFEAQMGETLRAALVDRGVLTELTPQEELDALSQALSAYHGRDPEAAVDALRRANRQGGEPYWSVTAAANEADLNRGGRRFDLLLFGDCDVQMEQDFLISAGRGHGLDLHVAATFPDDLSLAAERKHDAILIGALRARHTLTTPAQALNGQSPEALFIAQARYMIEELRRVTTAPILIDNLPEPSVQPLGLGERGALGHRNRFRLANVALAELVESYDDVHVVDIAAALAASGVDRLLDDAQVGFTHFGSPGWLLQRVEAEKEAVHGIFPSMDSLSQSLDADPYVRERITARAHMDALVTVARIDAKKCVIVDLDGVLWPGVLAETGAPFAWSPEVSSPFSFVGLFFGLHEALLALKKRGILLACVSKNDEQTVRDLWVFGDHYPRDRLLTLDDFATLRINWQDKAANIQSIADELGFDPSAFIFIDDNPIERERIRQTLPQIDLLGDDLMTLRRSLLSDPRLQTVHVTDEAQARTEMTKASLSRQKHQTAFADQDAFILSLDLKIDCARLTIDAPVATLSRIVELLQRTTQFNTTGLRPSVSELADLISGPQSDVFTVHAADRFGDYGLVGVIICDHCEITAFAVSCRVLGLGVDRALLNYAADHRTAQDQVLSARIIETARNFPARNIYRNNGFVLGEDGVWRR